MSWLQQASVALCGRVCAWCGERVRPRRGGLPLQPKPCACQCTQAPGGEHQVEWRMEATAHVASLVVRHMYCKVDVSRQCDLPDNVQLGPLKDWASKDYGW